MGGSNFRGMRIEIGLGSSQALIAYLTRPQTNGATRNGRLFGDRLNSFVVTLRYFKRSATGIASEIVHSSTTPGLPALVSTMR